MELELAVDVVQAQEAQEAQARTAQVLVVLADWGSAKGRQEAAGEAVEAHFAVQEVEAHFAVQEVQEVQDHPSHLPPDRAALARLARPLTAHPRPLPLQGRRPGPAGHQRR